MGLGYFLNRHDSSTLTVKSSQPGILLTFASGWPLVTLKDLQLLVCFDPNWPSQAQLWRVWGTNEDNLISTSLMWSPIIGSSVQFISVTQSCPTFCNPMNCSTPGLPVHHQLREFTQTHVHQVSDAIQPFHPLLSPSPPAPNPSQLTHVSQLFTSGGQSIGVSASASVLPMNTQDWSALGWTDWISLQSKVVIDI